MSGVAPAAWYPDPMGGAMHRWWDGAQWTEHLRDLATPVVAAAVTVAAVPVAAEPVVAEPVVPAYIPMGSFEPGMDAAQRFFTPRTRARPLPTFTAAGWWLALFPLWSVAFGFAIGVVLGIGAGMAGLDESTSRLASAGFILALLFSTAALTRRDRKELLREGHETAASSWWWLLGIFVYLIARSVHVHRATGRGWALPIVHAALGAGYIVVLVGIVLVLLPSGLLAL